ncbi:MAG: hypothetical protein IJN47_03280, partial [Clostridia bacterium]|nr:hypothetical protein [Clostridia bacterium]
MKRFLTILLALLLTVLPLTAAAASDSPSCKCPAGTVGAFYKGSGSEANPFRIRTEEELRHLEQHPDQHFRMDASLKISDWEPLCQETPFTGSLDGKNKKLTLSAPLFAKIGKEGYIFRLTLNGDMTAGEDAPFTGFAAEENAGRLYEIRAGGTLTVPEKAAPEAAIGGIVGRNTGFINSCSFTGSNRDLRAQPGIAVGAIAGVNDPATIPGLPAMITAHSGFAAEGGSGDKSEDNTIDNIIKSVCLQPDAIEVDVRIWTDPDGHKVPVLAHDKDMVGPDCPTVEEVLKLLMGDHPRAGELTENYKTILIQLDQKETAVAEHVFPLIDRLGFPLERVIFPVGAPASVEEDLAFWQELSGRGLQIWVTPDQLYYDDITAYADFLDTLQIPVVVNMSYEDATAKKIAHLQERGYGVSLWTLNTHTDIVENMAAGAFNLTSRLEEVLTVREGFRAGLLGND